MRHLWGDEDEDGGEVAQETESSNHGEEHSLDEPAGEAALHYGLTGGSVQNFKGSYLLWFLHSALVFKARGQYGHHAFPLT